MAKDKDDKKQDDKKQDAKAKAQGDKAVAAPKQARPQGKKEAPKAAPVEKADAPKIPAPPARLAEFYKEKVVPELTQKFGYKSPMQVPRLKKITLNMGVGETTTDKKVLDNAVADMRSEEHTSELQSHVNLVCRLLLEKKKKKKTNKNYTNNKNDNINSD